MMKTQERTEQLHCFYVNATSLIQVVRVAEGSRWLSERVVMPGNKIVFTAPAEAMLEIYTSELATGVLADRIPCCQLACSEQELAQWLATDQAILVG